MNKKKMPRAEICCAKQTDFTQSQELTNVAAPTLCPVLDDIKLPETAQPNTQYGNAIAISFDGSTMVIGDPTYEATEDERVGAVFVYKKNLSGSISCNADEKEFYVLQQVLLHPLLQNRADFGCKVALSANGRRLLVSARNEKDAESDERYGSVYVFDRISCDFCFIETQKLTAPEQIDDAEFGSALALSADGRVAIVSSDPNKQKGAFIYSTETLNACNRFDKTLHFATLLLPTDAEVSEIAQKNLILKDFGYSLTLSGDGKFAVVGDPSAELNNTDVIGAALLFERKGCTKEWALVDVLTDRPVTQTESRIGADVRLTPDGKNLFVFSNFLGEVPGLFPFTSVYAMKNGEKQFSLLEFIVATADQIPLGFNIFTRPLYLAVSDSACVLAVAYAFSPPLDPPDSRIGRVQIYKRCNQSSNFKPAETLSPPVTNNAFGVSPAMSGNATAFAAAFFIDTLKVIAYNSTKYRYC